MKQSCALLLLAFPAYASTLFTSASVFSSVKYCVTPDNCTFLSGGDSHTGVGSAMAQGGVSAPDGQGGGGAASAMASDGLLQVSGHGSGPAFGPGVGTGVVAFASAMDTYEILGGTGTGAIGLRVNNTCIDNCQASVAINLPPGPIMNGIVPSYIFQYGVPFTLTASARFSGSTGIFSVNGGGQINYSISLEPEFHTPPGITYKTLSGDPGSFILGASFAGTFIPEPGTIGGALAGLAGLGALWRRRRHAHRAARSVGNAGLRPEPGTLLNVVRKLFFRGVY